MMMRAFALGGKETWPSDLGGGATARPSAGAAARTMALRIRARARASRLIAAVNSIRTAGGGADAVSPNCCPIVAPGAGDRNRTTRYQSPKPGATRRRWLGPGVGASTRGSPYTSRLPLHV